MVTPRPPLTIPLRETHSGRRMLASFGDAGLQQKLSRLGGIGFDIPAELPGQLDVPLDGFGRVHAHTFDYPPPRLSCPAGAITRSPRAMLRVLSSVLRRDTLGEAD